MFRVLAGLAIPGAAIGAYFALSSTAPVGVPHNDPRQVAQGGVIYAEHCASCHGADLQGEPHWRYPDAEGYMPAPPHDGTGHTHEHPDPILFDTVKLGPEATVCTNRQSRMSGYAGILSDDEIVSVLAFIKSKWPEDAMRHNNRANGRPG